MSYPRPIYPRFSWELVAMNGVIASFFLRKAWKKNMINKINEFILSFISAQHNTMSGNLSFNNNYIRLKKNIHLCLLYLYPCIFWLYIYILSLYACIFYRYLLSFIFIFNLCILVFFIFIFLYFYILSFIFIFNLYILIYFIFIFLYFYIISFTFIFNLYILICFIFIFL